MQIGNTLWIIRPWFQKSKPSSKSEVNLQWELRSNVRMLWVVHSIHLWIILILLYSWAILQHIYIYIFFPSPHTHLLCAFPVCWEYHLNSSRLLLWPHLQSLSSANFAVATLESFYFLEWAKSVLASGPHSCCFCRELALPHMLPSLPPVFHLADSSCPSTLNLHDTFFENFFLSTQWTTPTVILHIY